MTKVVSDHLLIADFDLITQYVREFQTVKLARDGNSPIKYHN